MGPGFGLGSARAEAYREKRMRSSQYMKMLRFELVNPDNREYRAERWCFRGSIDSWWEAARVWVACQDCRRIRQAPRSGELLRADVEGARPAGDNPSDSSCPSLRFQRPSETFVPAAASGQDPAPLGRSPNSHWGGIYLHQARPCARSFAGDRLIALHDRSPSKNSTLQRRG